VGNGRSAVATPKGEERPAESRWSARRRADGCGELAHTLTRQGDVDQFWFWSTPTSGRQALGSSTA
jgi:hypothetical protein